MDFVECMTESINKNANIPLKVLIGYLGENESLVVNPIAGSSTVRMYFDGVKDQELNYEFVMKSKDGEKINTTLWKLQNYLEQLERLQSNDDSFSFNRIEMTNKPFIEQIDEQGWLVFVLDVKAHITVY